MSKRLVNAQLEQVKSCLTEQLKALSFSDATVRQSEYYLGKLDRFMGKNGFGEYSEYVGNAFKDYCAESHPRPRTMSAISLFVKRIDAIVFDRIFPTKIKQRDACPLPPGLESLHEAFRQHCIPKSYQAGTIEVYYEESYFLLNQLHMQGCAGASQINESSVVSACIALKVKHYLLAGRVLLRFFYEAGYTDKDYSYIVPYYRRPQAIPSVYSEDEISRIENAIKRGIHGKRDYAMLLLVTRIGLRGIDIVKLRYGEVDFEKDSIKLTQQKTSVPIELPLLPEIREAFWDYIRHEQPDPSSPYLFPQKTSALKHIDTKELRQAIAEAIGNTSIVVGDRKKGPHALRASLASSMANDDVPYEVIRKTLGHTNPNAIKHYARLDIEQLRLYALDVPAASGKFADFLCGRK